MNREQLTEKDFNNILIGTIFQIETWDSDDYHFWKMKYIKTPKGYMYLGGGMDCGNATGEIVDVLELIDEVNEHDSPSIDLLEFTLKENK